MNFIGRGERTVEIILGKLFEVGNVKPQYPLKSLLMFRPELYETYGTEVQKHKFDFYVERYHNTPLMVAVDYDHGDKADKKWNNILNPLLSDLGIVGVQIRDTECKHLFKDKIHPIDLDDWLEVFSLNKNIEQN